MSTGDNPPIGILLCTGSKQEMVRYALADKNDMVINEYRLKLPSERELQTFVEKQIKKL